MFGIPQNNTLTNAPNNVVHGLFSYVGFNNPAVADVEHLFTVPDGVYTIWVTMIGAGNCGAQPTADTYFGPSNNPYFKSAGQVAGTVAGVAASGQFSTLGRNGQSGYTNGTVTRGGTGPFGGGGDDNNVNANFQCYGSGGNGLGAAAWFYRAPLAVVPGMVIPYFVSGISVGSNPQGGPGLLVVEW